MRQLGSTADSPCLALAYHYAQLQSLAFEEDFDLAQQIDEIDKTYPKHHGMHRIAGDFMAEWNKEIEDDERAVASVKAATKRNAASVSPTGIKQKIADMLEGGS